jgi:hypothetical protein
MTAGSMPEEGIFLNLLISVGYFNEARFIDCFIGNFYQLEPVQYYYMLSLQHVIMVKKRK